MLKPWNIWNQKGISRMKALTYCCYGWILVVAGSRVGDICTKKNHRLSHYDGAEMSSIIN